MTLRTQTTTLPSTIHSTTHIGAVHLTVTNLDRSLDFYQTVLGFSIHRQSGDTASLGGGDRDLLILTAFPHGRRAASQRHTGLYHFAILTPSRQALAGSLRRLVEVNTRLGGADHGVSEAIYLSDPDGHGIEIYRDRPRTEWQMTNGQVAMTTEALDFQGILDELTVNPYSWEGLHPDTRIGHVHLHVAQLAAAVHFYRDVIGFGLMQHFGDSAAFLSAGGYHHHIGVNTWAGIGATPTPADVVGLRYFEVILPTDAERERIAQRLDSASLPYDRQGEAIFVRDPSQNGLLFKVAVGNGNE